MKERDNFTHLGFILATAGSAVGLGNIWKFPYMTFENNGGSFVLIYIITVLLVGFPIMMGEIIIGRSTQKSPVSAFLQLKHPAWSTIGWLGILTGFVILSYYSVVAGWTIHYFIKCIGWSIQGFTPEIAGSLGDQFAAFLAKPHLQIGYHALFMMFSVGVVIFGIENGIERLIRILMPVLLIIMILMVIVSIWSDGFSEAIAFLFKPSKIKPDAALEAVGHAFFSLSLGMGAIITYGSYMTRKESVPRAAAMVCFMDTLIALMACVIMFSLIFSLPEAERGQFSASIGVMFTSLPKLFYSMPGGAILSPLFFILVSFAALTSTISLLEVVVSFFIDHLKWSRVRATLLMGLVIFGFGCLSALSLGADPTLSNWKPLAGKSTGVFDTLDYLAANWFLPVGGILIAVFTGWILKSDFTRKELEQGHGAIGFLIPPGMIRFIKTWFPNWRKDSQKGLLSYHTIWRISWRFLAPLAIGWILYSVIFSGKAFN
jgi:NSS family neurotransmitter:Na+ symporter